MSKTFDDNRTGTGTMEWADWSENIAKGCANGCIYCYAAHNAIVKYKNVKEGEWQVESLTKRARMTSYPKREGVGMFPTTHDITPFNVDECIRVILLMLKAGNKLLIVSKPNLECSIKLLKAISDYKDQVMLRFTIGSINEHDVAFWEPGAPPVIERNHILYLAYKMGFRTSVSIEPMLSSVEDTIVLVEALRSSVTDSIWIGKMNRIDDRVLTALPEAKAKVEELKLMQSDENILKLVKQYENDPLIYWKDSIKEVIAAYTD
jgi:DNA repair photolyase